ncbi:DUF3035 domain-containing protein [Pseudooceanicola nanhaiensis]|uniref:DUF3035 domain-containing protein n=1 Tax=Pseudooceanicola nanhaiensis TaxID=375761 RepID=UPI001CD4E8F1|nr:DUF3035 domain-containing protein [Pseudooceanicola nanhaiensis]MCA0918872.1 DUF3035 domain-containing protein [Pseudooceanicola nanhaiensis]
MLLISVLALAACSSTPEGVTQLRSFKSSSDGPEEFAILPGKELEQPESYTSLPTPTPGGSNRTDQTPTADAVAALGGSPARLAQSGVPSDEGQLVAYATRNGVQPDIRQTLAQEDADFRKRKQRFTKIRLFKVDRYYQAYDDESLDGRGTAWSWRTAGAETPTNPPAE